MIKKRARFRAQISVHLFVALHRRCSQWAQFRARWAVPFLSLFFKQIPQYLGMLCFGARWCVFFVLETFVGLCCITPENNALMFSHFKVFADVCCAISFGFKLKQPCAHYASRSFKQQSCAHTEGSVSGQLFRARYPLRLFSFQLWGKRR